MKVSRLEAQLLLERYSECGNLLLRPSGDGTDGVSVTTRQILNGCASMAWPLRVGGESGRGRSQPRNRDRVGAGLELRGRALESGPAPGMGFHAVGERYSPDQAAKPLGEEVRCAGAGPLQVELVLGLG
jgi:hypothetical protein